MKQLKKGEYFSSISKVPLAVFVTGLVFSVAWTITAGFSLLALIIMLVSFVWCATYMLTPVMLGQDWRAVVKKKFQKHVKGPVYRLFAAIREFFAWKNLKRFLVEVIIWTLVIICGLWSLLTVVWVGGLLAWLIIYMFNGPDILGWMEIYLRVIRVMFIVWIGPTILASALLILGKVRKWRFPTILY